MKTKQCINCGKEKVIDEFYKHKMMADGHVNACKECQKKRIHKDYLKKSLDPEWKEKERARARDKFKRLYRGIKIDKELSRKYLKLNRLKYPEKYQAHNAVSDIKAEKGVHRHHWSYMEEHRKDVILLSTEDHFKCHRHTIYDQERMQYRTRDGVLLDSRESYIAYIKTKEDIKIKLH